MAKPAVILVGADKGGVGKTTVARTLLDYFTAHQVPMRAFDTEAPKGTLKRFHPDLTDVVDMTKVPDQMKIFDTLNCVRCRRHADRRARRPDVADAAGVARHRLHRGGEEGPDHVRGVPHPRPLDRLARRDRRDRRLSRRRPLLPGEELHQQHALLRMGRGDPRGLLQQDQGRGRDHDPEAQRDGDRAGRARLGALPDLHRQQEAGRRTRHLFLRAARLCAALARQRLGRVRPHQADRRRRGAAAGAEAAPRAQARG